MTPEELVNLYYQKPQKKPEDPKIPSGLNESSETSDSDGVGKVKVTHLVDVTKKHPKTGCAWDAMGPLAGSGESGPFDGLNDGEGAQIGESSAPAAPAAPASGGAMGESMLTRKEFNAILEGLMEKYPNSSAPAQIRAMFNSMQSGGNGQLYCGADGCESLGNPMKEQITEGNQLISAATATVEAALMTYRILTGQDYPGVVNYPPPKGGELLGFASTEPLVQTR